MQRGANRFSQTREELQPWGRRTLTRRSYNGRGGTQASLKQLCLANAGDIPHHAADLMELTALDEAARKENPGCQRLRLQMLWRYQLNQSTLGLMSPLARSLRQAFPRHAASQIFKTSNCISPRTLSKLSTSYVRIWLPPRKLGSWLSNRSEVGFP